MFAFRRRKGKNVKSVNEGATQQSAASIAANPASILAANRPEAATTAGLAHLPFKLAYPNAGNPVSQAPAAAEIPATNPTQSSALQNYLNKPIVKAERPTSSDRSCANAATADAKCSSLLHTTGG